MSRYRLLKVDWDLTVDGEVDEDGHEITEYTLEQASLSPFIFVPLEENGQLIEDDMVADWLSDEYGWCVNDWEEIANSDQVEELGKKHGSQKDR